MEINKPFDTAPGIEVCRDYRDAFFAEAIGLEHILDLLWGSENDCVVIKDRLGRYVSCNRAFALRFGSAEPDDFILKNDLDLFPDDLVNTYIENDRRVIDSRESKLDHTELYLSNNEGLGECTTSRTPVVNRRDEVIGVTVVSRQFRMVDSDDTTASHDLCRINDLIALIRDNPGKSFTNEEMAKASNVSVRHLNRIVQKHAQLSPRNFANQTRIQIACRELMETDRPIVDIAMDVGFCDQSWFSVQFRKVTGTTPGKFRELWKKKSG